MHLIRQLQNRWRKKLIELEVEIGKSIITVEQVIIKSMKMSNIWIILTNLTLLNFIGCFTLTTSKYSFFFKCTWNTNKINHILGHRRSLKCFTNIRVISCVFSEYSGIQLQTNNRKAPGKSSNIWKLNITHLNNPRVKEEIKREIRKYF